MTYDTVFAALGDPTRRKVFERLVVKPAPVGVLAAGLPVSRPAVSQHLKVLSDAGLVEVRTEGTRRIYAVRPERLNDLRQWVDGLWTEALQAFADAAKKERQP